MNTGDMKEHNMKLCLACFTFTRRLSRADVVRMTKLSAPTVSKLVEALINDNLLVETTVYTNNRGRPATLLERVKPATDDYQI